MTILEPRESSALRRITPQCPLPSGEFLMPLNDIERRLLARRLNEPAECVVDPLFQDPDTRRRLRAALTKRGARLAIAEDSDDRSSGDHERSVFLHFNFARYRVLRILRESKGKELTPKSIRDLVRWESLVRALRGEIVRANVPLVLAMAKRTKITSVDQSDLISEGNLALLRSVDKFDCSRGFKFSTYACRAILKSFSRVASRTARYRGYFPTEFDPLLERSDHADEKRRGLEHDCVNELKSILSNNMAKLNDIEKTVIKARFAIEDAAAPPQPDDAAASKAKTLEQVGEMIGVTKERVRQIQNKALTKLRLVLEDAVLSS